MIGLLLAANALAGPPTRVVAVLEAGQSVYDVEVAGDGSAVALSDETGGAIYVLDVGTWSLVDITPCEKPAGLVAAPGTDNRFWVGCLDGSVVRVDFEDGALSYQSDPIFASDTAILGLTASDSLVFVLADNPAEGGAAQVHTVGIEDGLIDGIGGYPSNAGAAGFEDIAYSGTGVYITHGGSQITRMEGGSGTATLQQQSVGGASTGDILPLPGTALLVAGGSAGVLSYLTGSNQLVTLLNDDEGVDNATALALDLTGGFMLVADQGAGGFLRFGAGTTGLPSGEVVQTLSYPSGGGEVTELGVLDGYVIAGTIDGQVWVLTDRPWVEAEHPQPRNAVSGTGVGIDFVSDMDGTWKARLNGADNTDGVVVDSGSCKAGEVETASFTVGSSFREGTNRIRIVVTGEDGAEGHDTSVLSVDNPPTRVSLRSSHVGWGDRQVEVRIPGISDEDLVHYEVFLSATDFSDEEYTTGGPGFDGAPGDVGAGRLNLPRTVSADPGQDIEITIAPLTNGVTYYVAVRATDEAGQEGPMSKVVSVKPQQTYGAADLAGEKGGMTCGSVGAGAASLLGIIGVLLVGLRRSTGPMAAVLLMLSLPAQAEADWPQKVKGWHEIKGNTFEVRYGPIRFDDSSIDAIFGETGNNMMMLEFGPTFYDLAEIKGSVGYFHGEGNRISSSGAVSSQYDYLNLYPVSVDMTARLDVLPEQPLVPFAGVGIDYFFWREIWQGGGGSGRQNISGGKPGWHTTYGAHILLDTFNIRRASKLAAVTGITDSYITVEVREQRVGEDQGGLKFSGNTLTFGLKFDH